MKQRSMLWKVILAVLLAFIAGSLTGTDKEVFGVTFYSVYSLGGQLFLNALTLLVVPLIASAIIHGIGGMGKEKSFKRLGTKTFFFYILTTLLAVLTGLFFVNLLEPGTYHKTVQASVDSSHITPLTATSPASHQEALSEIALKLIPSNILNAAASGNMLGIIFFSLVFGFALIQIESKASQMLSNIWKALFYTLMKMTHFVMKVMPIGVFCLVAKVIASQGLESVKGLILFFVTVLLGLAVFMLIILPLLLWMLGLDPLKHIKALAPALITAFSTSSSMAALPVTLDCVEKRMGISNKIASFVVPLGTSVNMSGSALYECVAVLFIAQIYQIDLSFMHQFIIVILSLLTSMGVAGIPSASLVAILIILNAMGFPAEGLALILPVDRILDMCRTTVNVFSDASCAALVAHSEGETILQKR